MSTAVQYSDLEEAAPVAAEAVPVSRASLEEVIDEVVDACTNQGLTPMEAARQSTLLAGLDVEELYALAIIGLARTAAARIPKPPARRSARRASPPNHAERERKLAQIEARRQRLYEEAKDTLASLFRGADGRMRPLYQFTAEDHRHRLEECESFTRGWRLAARFHQEAITALKREGVDTVQHLSVGEQDRLRRLL